MRVVVLTLFLAVLGWAKPLDGVVVMGEPSPWLKAAKIVEPDHFPGTVGVLGKPSQFKVKALIDPTLNYEPEAEATVPAPPPKVQKDKPEEIIKESKEEAKEAEDAKEEAKEILSEEKSKLKSAIDNVKEAAKIEVKKADVAARDAVKTAAKVLNKVQALGGRISVEGSVMLIRHDLEEISNRQSMDEKAIAKLIKIFKKFKRSTPVSTEEYNQAMDAFKLAKEASANATKFATQQRAMVIPSIPSTMAAAVKAETTAVEAKLDLARAEAALSIARKGLKLPEVSAALHELVDDAHRVSSKVSVELEVVDETVADTLATTAASQAVNAEFLAEQAVEFARMSKNNALEEGLSMEQEEAIAKLAVRTQEFAEEAIALTKKAEVAAAEADTKFGLKLFDEVKTAYAITTAALKNASRANVHAAQTALEAHEVVVYGVDPVDQSIGRIASSLINKSSNVRKLVLYMVEVTQRLQGAERKDAKARSVAAIQFAAKAVFTAENARRLARKAFDGPVEGREEISEELGVLEKSFNYFYSKVEQKFEEAATVSGTLDSTNSADAKGLAVPVVSNTTEEAVAEANEASEAAKAADAPAEETAPAVADPDLKPALEKMDEKIKEELASEGEVSGDDKVAAEKASIEARKEEKTEEAAEAVEEEKKEEQAKENATITADETKGEAIVQKAELAAEKAKEEVTKLEEAVKEAPPALKEAEKPAIEQAKRVAERAERDALRADRLEKAVVTSTEPEKAEEVVAEMEKIEESAEKAEEQVVDKAKEVRDIDPKEVVEKEVKKEAAAIVDPKLQLKTEKKVDALEKKVEQKLKVVEKKEGEKGDEIEKVEKLLAAPGLKPETKAKLETIAQTDKEKYEILNVTDTLEKDIKNKIPAVRVAADASTEALKVAVEAKLEAKNAVPEEKVKLEAKAAVAKQVALNAEKEELKAEYKVQKAMDDVAEVKEGMKKTAIASQELKDAIKPGAVKSTPAAKIKSLMRKVERKKETVIEESADVKTELKQASEDSKAAKKAETAVKAVEKEIAKEVKPVVVCKKGDLECVQKIIAGSCNATAPVRCKVDIYRKESPCKSAECDKKFIACANQTASEEAVKCHTDLFTEFKGDKEEASVADVKAEAKEVIKEVSKEVPEAKPTAPATAPSLLERADRFTQRPDYISPSVVDHLDLSN